MKTKGLVPFFLLMWYAQLHQSIGGGTRDPPLSLDNASKKRLRYSNRAVDYSNRTVTSLHFFQKL